MASLFAFALAQGTPRMASNFHLNADTFHGSLQPLFSECRDWLQYSAHQALLETEMGKLANWLSSSESRTTPFGHAIERIGHHYAIAACDACGRGEYADIARFLRWAIDFRALPIRISAAYARTHPEEALEKPTEYWDSMRAAGPAMISAWNATAKVAESFILLAERDQRMRGPASRRLRHGSNDAFLIDLFAQGLGIKTDFVPVEPLIPEYRELLDQWRTADPIVYRDRMSAAADFHISRSKAGTDRRTYEFEKDIDRIFPAELLMVQALRRRDSLPEIDTGHALIDAPWSVLSNLPPAEAHPLFTAVETRLAVEKPGFK